MFNEIYLSVFTILDEYGDMGPPHVLMAYIFPTLACLTVFGNFLFILSVACTELRKKTTGMLLMSSNISSIIQTVSSCCIVYYPWLFNEKDEGELFPCNLLVSSYHFFAAWSVYLLTCACIDRYIAICHPLFKLFITSQPASKQCIMAVITTFLASSVLSAPLIWFSALTIIEEVPGKGNITYCYYTEENWYMEIHEYVELTFYSILPFLIILFCNVAIIRKIYFHKITLQAFRNKGSSRNKMMNVQNLPHADQAARLSVILLPISFLHLIFSGIVVICIILEHTVAETAEMKLNLLTVSYNAAQLQAGYYFYANLSLSSVFRHLLKKLFCKTRVNTYLFSGGETSAEISRISKLKTSNLNVSETVFQIGYSRDVHLELAHR